MDRHVVRRTSQLKIHGFRAWPYVAYGVSLDATGQEELVASLKKKKALSQACACRCHTLMAEDQPRDANGSAFQGQSSRLIFSLRAICFHAPSS